jgi:two-component system, chemotaxis family, protein-glutamate methylesterase/glutaminase
VLRILVVEDSPTVRALLVAILESDPDVCVVGEAGTGSEAVAQAARLDPDLITMDIHMPGLDGLEATKEIMVARPTPIVIVSSSDGARDGGRTFDAMRAGALMVLEKPADPSTPDFPERARSFVATVKGLADVKLVHQSRRRSGRSGAGGAVAPPGRSSGDAVVVMGTSTGGPVVLERILSQLSPDFAAPILIVQHIAGGFVHSLVEWLRGRSRPRLKLAEDREPLRPRTAYLAPDGFHLGVGAAGEVTLDAAPPVHGHRPSATFLFETAARRRGPGTTAVILTGMGRDGVEGLRLVRQRGGHVIAQSPESCAVSGMPGEAIALGLAHSVLDPEGIAGALNALHAGSTP